MFWEKVYSFNFPIYGLKWSIDKCVNVIEHSWTSLSLSTMPFYQWMLEQCLGSPRTHWPNKGWRGIPRSSIPLYFNKPNSNCKVFWPSHLTLMHLLVLKMSIFSSTKYFQDGTKRYFLRPKLCSTHKVSTSLYGKNKIILVWFQKIQRLLPFRLFFFFLVLKKSKNFTGYIQLFGNL